MFYCPLIVLDGDGVIESLQHSVRLVWGNLLRTIVVMLVLGVVGLMFCLTVLFLMLESTTDISLWNMLVASVLNALGLPLLCAFMVVQLNDMKLRKGEVRP